MAPSTASIPARNIGASVPLLATWVVDNYTGTDDQKLAAAFADWEASSHGGTLLFPARVMTLANQYVTSYSTSVKKYLHLKGAGAAMNGLWGAVDGISGVDAQWNGTGAAKFVFQHIGVAEVSGLWVKDTAGDSKPFMIFTNAQPKVHDNTFTGSKTGLLCDQDVILLGGTTNTIGAGDNAPFQGYGGVVRDNSFDGIRRATYFRTYANGLEFSRNTISKTCGSNLAGGACVELHGNLGATGDNVFGNRITGNTFESTYYPYTIRCDYAQANVFDANGFYDPSSCLAYHYFASVNAKHNLVRPTFWDSLGATVKLADMAGGVVLDYNTVLDQISGGWVVDVPVSFGNGLTTRAFGAGAGAQVQFTKQVGDATAGACFDNYGRTWHYQGVGGDLKIDTGTGGSFLNLLAWQVRLFDQTGVQRGSLLSGSTYKGALQSGTGVTGSRPSASTCGAGAMWYDTTLSKPIWSDGTVWRDAAGTAV